MQFVSLGWINQMGVVGKSLLSSSFPAGVLWSWADNDEYLASWPDGDELLTEWTES